TGTDASRPVLLRDSANDRLPLSSKKMRRVHSISELFTFGGRVPATVGGLLSAIVAASLLGRLGQSIAFVDLVPGLVWRGQVWRLVTWTFFETSPIPLLFGCLTLYWFGRDLCFAWGSTRFLTSFLGIAAGAAAVTCLIARVVPPLLRTPFIGAWPVILALTVAWSIIFPERQVLFMMVLPIAGRTLVWITLGGTLLYAVFDTFLAYVPHLAAQLLMIAYCRGWSLRGLWQSLRIKQYERRARRRATRFKVVRKEDRWLN
ncbi:MAG TPA: rhomboid family intramembrane serine protease, partial [Anaeromyxobacteraceae bacterium]|nr:rhomboid family intramembrane serine protease [Anaeromyxobacteraceae bacterium]